MNREIQMTRISIVIFILLFLAAMLFSGCSAGYNEKESLHIGTHAWPGYEPLHLSKSLGHLDDRVKLVEFESASNVIRAMKNGSIDGATLTLDEALIVKESGINIKIVLVNDFSWGGDAVLLHGKYSKNQSLKGLKIGVEGGAVGAYTLSRALEIQGLDLSDVTPVQLEPARQKIPLRDGVIDGVVTFEPFRSLILEDGAVEVFSSRQIPREIVDVTVLTESSINNAPYLTENLVSSWYEVIDFIKSQPDEAYERMARYRQLSTAEVKRAMELIYLPDRMQVEKLTKPDGELRVNAEKLMNLMVSKNLLPATIDINLFF